MCAPAIAVMFDFRRAIIDCNHRTQYVMCACASLYYASLQSRYRQLARCKLSVCAQPGDAGGMVQMATGALGGMGGCAMIGQSLINFNAGGGTTRVAGMVCGASLLAYILFAGSIIEMIPMAALTGVMLVLVLDIFDFTSFARLHQVPRTDAVVLVLVTAVTYMTNLAVAVAAGVILSSLAFSWQSAQRGVSAARSWDGDTLVFSLRGPLFFGSVQSFRDAVRQSAGDAVQSVSADSLDAMRKDIVLDFLDCRVWDSSAIEVINSEAERLQGDGWHVRLRHLSKDCRSMLDRAGDMIELEVWCHTTYRLCNMPCRAKWCCNARSMRTLKPKRADIAGRFLYAFWSLFSCMNCHQLLCASAGLAR